MKFEIGDVLLLSDGRMIRVMEMHPYKYCADSIHVQFIDRNEESTHDVATFDIERNLGQSESVLATFYTTRGIHRRLNETKMF